MTCLCATKRWRRASKQRVLPLLLLLLLLLKERLLAGRDEAAERVSMD